LLDDRQRHVELLDDSIEAAENLCAVLSCEGRDVIHEQIGALQQEWDELLMKLMFSQQQVELSLVEWTSYTDCMGQVEAWFAKMRSLLSDELPLVATLDEKKSQLQMCKVIQLYTMLQFLMLRHFRHRILFLFVNLTSIKLMDWFESICVDVFFSLEKLTRLVVVTDIRMTWFILDIYSIPPLHSTPLTGRAIKPQRQGHIGGPIAQP